MLRTLLLAFALLAAFPLRAQDDAQRATQRALIEREQQSEFFSLQLQQSQRRLDAGGVNGPALDALQLEQRQQRALLDQQQLRQITGSPAYDRARNERDRAALQLRFSSQTPAWGPVLEPRHWTPTLDE